MENKKIWQGDGGFNHIPEDKPQLDWRDRLDGLSNHTHDATGLRLFDFKELESFIAEVEKLAEERGYKNNLVEEGIMNEIVTSTRSSLKAEIQAKLAERIHPYCPENCWEKIEQVLNEAK